MTFYNTLFMLLIFSFAISSIAMWVNWYLNPHETAVRYWAIALTIILSGCAILAYARMHLPSTEAMIPFGFFTVLRDFAKSLNALSWVVLWVGMLMFMGRSVPSGKTIAAIWLVFFALFLIAHPLGIPGAWGIAWISTIVSFFSVLILYEILKPGIGGVATWFASAGFLLAAITWGIRAILSFIDLGRLIDSEFDSGVIFGAIISVYACMLSMVLLTNQRLIDRLGSLESRDPLTKVLNRHAFIQSAEGLLKRAEEAKQDCALVLINIDHCREINREHGQHLGDMALTLLAETSLRVLGRQDLFARCGGDEFVFFLYGQETDQAQKTMEGLRVLLEQNRVESVKGAFPVRVSIGIAGSRTNSSTDELVQFADRALCQAKAQGRNQSVTYEQANTAV